MPHAVILYIQLCNSSDIESITQLTCVTAIPFSGYDNTGARHRQQRGGSGETSAQVSSAAPPDQAERRHWARAVGTKRMVPQFPQASGPAGPPARIAPVTKQFNRPAAEKKYYSDGESEDEM
jgi:hypothetical protein